MGFVGGRPAGQPAAFLRVMRRHRGRRRDRSGPIRRASREIPQRGFGISRLENRATHDEMRGALPHRLGGRRAAALIAGVVAGPPNPRNDDERLGPQSGANPVHLERTADHAGQSAGHGDPRQPCRLVQQTHRRATQRRRVFGFVVRSQDRDSHHHHLAVRRSAAARHIAVPPSVCTVAIRTPSARAAATAPRTVLGMSCHLRSRKTESPWPASPAPARDPRPS